MTAETKPDGKKQGPQKRLRRAKGARLLSLNLLISVLDDYQPFDLVWAKALAPDGAAARLSPADRALARQIIATVLRRMGELDAVIDACMERPLSEKAQKTRHILRIGAAQVLLMRIPAHAAINETVQLAGVRNKFRPLINAVLRRIEREGTDILNNLDTEQINCPPWLWQSWSQSYGQENARKIVTALLSEPVLDITVKDAPEKWAEPLQAAVLPTGSLRRALGGRIEELPGFDEGAWWVQDAAAALPVRLLGEVTGKRVLDMCCAPGGKLCQLAAAGASVTGLDQSAERLQRVQENLDRLGLGAELICADASQWSYSQDLFDAVLLDAPCSATGTIRRHPDVWRLKQPKSVERVVKTQDRLLGRAAELVKPGGLLIFCTCSLQPEEGEERVSAFLARHPEFTREVIAPGEAGIDENWLTTDGDLRTLPSHLGAAAGGLDGFFASRLRRKDQ